MTELAAKKIFSRHSTVRSDLVRAGLVPNCEKSVWTPVQRLEWLSISWDLLSAFLSISQPRIDRLLSALSLFKDRLPFVTPRFVASIVGKIISLSISLIHFILIHFPHHVEISAVCSHLSGRLGYSS